MKQRDRMIRPEFFQNRKLAELKPHARILYTGLWTLADREGLLIDSAELIKGYVFPFEKLNVDKLLQELHDSGFINRFEADSERYIYIYTFKKHQHIHPHEAQSVIHVKLLSLQCDYNVLTMSVTSTSTSTSTSASTILPPTIDKMVKFQEDWDGFNKADYQHLDLDTIYTKIRNWVANKKQQKHYKTSILSWLNNELSSRNKPQSEGGFAEASKLFLARGDDDE